MLQSFNLLCPAPDSHTYFPKLLWRFHFLMVFLCPYVLSAQSGLERTVSPLDQESTDSLEIVNNINGVREIHYKNRNEGKHSEEKEYALARKAVQDALSLNDTVLYARALDNLGLLYRYHQRYDEAIPLHIKAYKLIQDMSGNFLYKMIFANNAGVAGRYDQKYGLAVTYYMKALKIAERENDLKNIAISSNGIGNALGNIPGRQDEALTYFKRSLEAEKKRDNSLGIAMNYLSISDYYINKEEYATARDYLERLLEINQNRNDLYGLAITYEFYGKSYLKEGKNLGKAAAFFRNSLDRFEELKDEHKQAEILTSLGNIQLKRNKIDSAREYFQKSLALSKKVGYQGLIMENSFHLANIYEENQNPTQALKFLKLGERYEDSINLAEQNVEIAALIRKYNLEKKENHIQLLQKDKALQQTLLENQKQKLDKRNVYLILMGIGFSFLIILFLLQYRHSKIKKKKDAEIQKQEKEKVKAIYERNLARSEILVTRLRVNPHFLFNSLNAIKYLIQSEQNRKAVKYLVVFSRYTRMVLETSQKHVVPLAEELQLARYYLILEENRFEEDFTYQLEGFEAPEIEDANIPPLLLQPFIENAIWHGLLPSKNEKKILLIKVVPQDNSIQIIIDDNGAGRKNKNQKQSKKGHKSMGMEIVKERIELFNDSYENKLDYEIIDKKNDEGHPEGTRVVFKLLKNQSIEKPVKQYL
ncbi:MAG TPA: tetratricopeptide repeat protein [Salinimicrobium sp.]|nr:tetratricopeptide repeat protein [Salinimicrobium sp.]